MFYTLIQQALPKKNHMTAITECLIKHTWWCYKHLQKFSNLKKFLNLVSCLLDWILLQCCISIFQVVSLQKNSIQNWLLHIALTLNLLFSLFTYIPGRLSHSIHWEAFEVELSEVRHSDIHLRTHHIQTNVNIGHLQKNKLKQNIQCL